MVHHNANIFAVDNSIAVEVNDGDDWCLPYIPAIESAGPLRFEVES
jgi:hypothetical protein